MKIFFVDDPCEDAWGNPRPGVYGIVAGDPVGVTDESGEVAEYRVNLSYREAREAKLVYGRGADGWAQVWEGADNMETVRSYRTRQERPRIHELRGQ
jgi:hypothetical protein